ncbi:transglycosylase domain-containing protein [Siminovitchia sp. FSL H7-0308]|uniref:Penicillin-binding protein n=1 Tax=Siminovitchia thermophila TaxID=1245522 RepID=A0ABS2R6L8_9BACI|nr:transglycosylase domain-containing protein [Siminovitchia thermophila]MBM7715244.1 penicillin-binding protein [Siminovitchia thermophila]ONK24031.1 peptidoglycan glycosyltransferase [Bacillus sp. VT-16-64]
MKSFLKARWERLKQRAFTIEKKEWMKGFRITYGVAWNLTFLLTIFLVLGGIFAGGVGAGYFASLVKDEKVRPASNMKQEIFHYEETSKLYFADNIYLGKLQSDIDREEVSIEEVSDHLKKAVIATEDEYFYEHKGVVPKALMRAVFQELTNSSVQTGGSTLTQQLIKNQILTNEVSFDRKAKEILLALRLEKFLEKDEILEAYLNVSTFGRNSSGQNIGGVQAAARGIFGVDAKELNLPQAAFIAGLPQSPFRYTPFANGGGLKEESLLEPGLNRMKTVLARMRAEEFITQKEYEEAIHYNIVGDFIKPQPRAYEQYPYLTEEIERRGITILMEILAKKDGYSEKDLQKDKGLYNKYETLARRDIRHNGYHIHTTIHKQIYDTHQKVKDEYNNYGYTKVRQERNPETGKLEKIKEPVQVGAILIENKTGKILSFVGGRDHKLEATNHATKAKRQNGSTMKPLLVYAPAMEMGLSAPGAVVADIPLSTGGKVFRNYSGRYYGLVSSRKALAHSYNASAVYTYLKTVNNNPAAYLEKMGFTTLTKADHTNIAAALGGVEDGVTVEENTNAFTTFANGGKFIDAYMIEKITDHDGNIIYEHKAKPVDVFSPQTSYLMIDMMRDVLRYGTASAVPGMLKFSADWAGKTGTTNGPNDAWFVASNPNVTLGAWIGYGKPAPLSTDGSEGRRNLNIWARLMNGAYDAAPDLVKPKERFKMPGGIVRRSYCGISGMLPSKACSAAGLVQSDLFNAKFVPTKVDNSLGNGRYVMIKGKKYMALPSTPQEFTKPGGMLSPEFVKQISLGRAINPAYLIPDNDPRWKNLLAAGAIMQDDGKAPASVSTTMSNGLLTWNESPSHDVVGYRVYSGSGKRVASIASGSSLSYRAGGGSYYVVAVDIAGRESAPSNKMETKQVNKPAKTEDTQKKQTEVDKNKDKDNNKEQQAPTPPAPNTPPPKKEEPKEEPKDQQKDDGKKEEPKEPNQGGNDGNGNENGGNPVPDKKEEPNQ